MLPGEKVKATLAALKDRLSELSSNKNKMKLADKKNEIFENFAMLFVIMSNNDLAALINLSDDLRQKLDGDNSTPFIYFKFSGFPWLERAMREHQDDIKGSRKIDERDFFEAFMEWQVKQYGVECRKHIIDQMQAMHTNLIAHPIIQQLILQSNKKTADHASIPLPAQKPKASTPPPKPKTTEAQKELLHHYADLLADLQKVKTELDAGKAIKPLRVVKALQEFELLSKEVRAVTLTLNGTPDVNINAQISLYSAVGVQYAQNSRGEHVRFASARADTAPFSIDRAKKQKDFEPDQKAALGNLIGLLTHVTNHYKPILEQEVIEDKHNKKKGPPKRF